MGNKVWQEQLRRNFSLPKRCGLEESSTKLIDACVVLSKRRAAGVGDTRLKVRTGMHARPVAPASEEVAFRCSGHKVPKAGKEVE